MNKKASILTFHCVPNYGAVLQAYALQEVLKNFFDEVEILDYRPNNLTREYNVINYYSVFSVATTLFSSSSFKKKKQRFFEYENKYFNLSSQHIINISSLKNYRTDALFLGSDQIWNPDITNGFDKAYFGKFDIADSAKVISYAASIGKNSITNTQSYILNHLLNGIDAISVRESQAKDILQNLCDKSIEVVADPTILAGREYFDCMVTKKEKKPYVLLYSLNGYEETEKLAEDVAEFKGLKLIELSGRRKPILKPHHKAIYDAGPEEFVSYIANAEFVVTDSFHGTVFSLLYHKNFLTVPHKTRGARIVNLLNVADVSSRLTDKFSEDIASPKINWEKVDENLNVERKKSYDFIKKAIKS